MNDDSAVAAPKIVVFYSYTGGVGRSATVANLAVILANSGRRILVLDLDHESPTQHLYLRPFIPGDASSASMVDPLGLDAGFARRGGVLGFAGPLTQPHDGSSAPDGQTAAGPADWRQALRTAPYDLVLVDAPSGGSQQAANAVDAADLLVLQWSPDIQSIRGGVRSMLAAETRTGRDVEVIPVSMYFDSRGGGQAERARATARRHFAALRKEPDSGSSGSSGSTDQGVEIPYVADYAFDARLVILEPPSETRNRLLETYRELAAAVAGVPLTELDPAELPPHPSRSRYLIQYEIPKLSVVYSAKDRAWAEWAVANLEGAGVAARPLCLDDRTAAELDEASSVAFVASASFAASPACPAVAERLSVFAAAAQITVLAIDIDGSGAAAVVNVPTSVLRLGDLDEAEARSRLLDFYAPAEATQDRATRDIRFPTRRPASTNLPPQVHEFTGRDGELEDIRDHFAMGTGAAPYWVQGVPTVGKTALAHEYAHRFASQYDTVWVIPSDSARTIRRSLGELATAYRLPRRGDAPAAVLTELNTGGGGRWLLVYDGADDRSVLEGLLPAIGNGDVLITSVNSPLDGAARSELSPLDAEVVLDLLAKLLPNATEQSRIRLRDALTDRRPMAVRLAATWVRERARSLSGVWPDIAGTSGEAVEELEQAILTAAPGDGDFAFLRQVVALLLRQLEEVVLGGAAVRFLRTCTFLSPSGVSAGLLESPAFVADLRETAPALLDDPIVLHTLRHVLARHGFLLANQAVQASVQVNRRLLDAVRALMTSEEVDDRRRRVIRIVAAYAPQDAQRVTSARYPVYAELQRHLDVIDPSDDLDPSVRRWLLGQIDFLYSRMESGPWNLAAEWGRRLQSSWRTALADPDEDPLFLELQFHRANVERVLGRYRAAYDLDAGTVERQRARLGVRHPRTLMTARGLGADLRLLGEFEDAQLEETSTWRSFQEELGDDHEMTVVAASNLALSETLVGSPLQAVERENEVLQRSEPLARRHPEYPAWAMAHLGWHLRELGRYEESRQRIVEARDELSRLMREDVLSRSMRIVLTTDASLAATGRRLAPQDTPGPLVREALMIAEQAFSPDDLLVLTLRSAIAAEEHVVGNHRRALTTATKCHETSVRIFGEGHPFTGVCAVNAAIYAHHLQAEEEAARWAERGSSILADSLGETHPWTLIAHLGLGWIRASRNRPTGLPETIDRKVAAIRFTSGSQHPVVIAHEFLRRDARPSRLHTPCEHAFELELPLYI